MQIETGNEQYGQTEIHVYGDTVDKIEEARITIERSMGYLPEDPRDVVIDWGNIKADFEQAQKAKWNTFPEMTKGE